MLCTIVTKTGAMRTRTRSGQGKEGAKSGMNKTSGHSFFGKSADRERSRGFLDPLLGRRTEKKVSGGPAVAVKQRRQP